MLRLVYGQSGCGKSAYFYSQIIEDLKAGKRPILIVPDQNILMAERKLSEVADGVSTFDLEVISFRRLSDYVFRLTGGLSFNTVDERDLLMIMWRTLREVSPFLKNYTNVDDKNSAFAELMYSTVKELKQFSITPAMLSTAGDKLSQQDKNLSCKLQDISFIYGAYQSFVSKEYNDPSDELTRLADTLKENTVFASNTVYFDGFDGFTPQQYSVLREIVLQSENISVSLCFDPSDKSGVFNTTLKTYSNLKKMAKESDTELSEVYLENKNDESSDPIRYVLRNLWNHNVSYDVFNGDSTGVNTYCCHDRYEECELVVADILKKVRNGARYKDFLIIARDIHSYEGLVDTELENSGVPFFMSRRTDLKSRPIFKLILAAFSVINKGWRFSDVISYAKTGLTGVSYEECDMLENYASTWNICGRRWYDGIEWNMNPDGLFEKISEQGKEKVNTVNEIRNRIVMPLVKLRESIGKTTVRELTLALYSFLCELKVRDQIEKQAAERHNEMLFAEEKELIQLWNVLMDTLDSIVRTLGDMVLDSDDYFSLLELVLGKTDIGVIPPTIDQVLLGSASNLRSESVKHVYLLGVNDGVFPKNVEENSIFNDSEKFLLSQLEVNLSPATDEQTMDELYWFYRSLSRAEETISVIYSESDLKGASNKISVAGSRINYLLNKKDVIKYSDIPPLEKLVNQATAMKIMSLNRDNELGTAIHNVFSDDSDMGALFEAFGAPLVTTDTNIMPEVSAELYKGNISTTQTKIEEYVKCPFNYHFTHVLGLKESKRAVFRNNDIGSFVHEVLEKFVARIAADDGINTDISDDEIERIVKEIVSDYIYFISESIPQQSKRLLQMFKRLERTTLLLAKNIVKEFSQSDFIPQFFELPIMPERDAGLKPYEIPLDDGTKLYMRGFVDRVDTFKKGDDVYIRVVDYKTGNKTFSLDDIEKGLNLQMFLYLFAIWNTKEEWFKERVKCNGNLIPAGVLYFAAKSPGVSIEDESMLDFVVSAAEDSIERKGVLINDVEILKAMENDLQGKYIPVKIQKNGKLSNDKYLKTLEEFGQLSDQIECILNGIAKDMKSGCVSAKPLEIKPGTKPCIYCKMRPICRHSVKGNEDE